MEANYLQLIYIRKESDYDNHKHKTEAILNGKYNIKQKDNGKIIVKKEKHYIAGLWGKSISDCYAIVGEKWFRKNTADEYNNGTVQMPERQKFSWFRADLYFV